MCFTGIASQLGGLGFEQIALRTLSVHDRGFSPDGGYTVARRDVFEDCGEGELRVVQESTEEWIYTLYGVYSYIPQLFFAK